MKNTIKIAALAFLGALSLASCGDDFINEAKPSTGVPIEDVFESRNTANGALSGIMRNFRSQYMSTDSGGVNSMFFARTVKGNDAIVASNWYSFDYENDNREPVYRRTNFSWNYPYFMINQINSFIKGVLGSQKLTATDKNELTGQGYALRAFFYHQLVLEFSKSYKLDPNYPAPPIYKEPTLVGGPMTTVKVMYDFIVEDLTKSIELCSASRLGKSYVNKQVATALLAQVYQVMGKWDLAETTSNAAYGGNVTAVLDALSYGNGFKDYSSKEWLWGTPQSEAQSMYYFLAPHAFSDHRATAYLNVYVNADFVKLFSATDVRGGIGPNKLFNLKSSTYPVTDFRYYVSNKFSFTTSSHSPLIRFAELILIDAEAKARLGKEAEAKTILYALQKNRDTDAVQSAASGQALIDEILIERRKELFMENGIEWFDAKRLGIGMPRTGNQRLQGMNGSITFGLLANDNRFFLKVPQTEIDANANIDDSVNRDR